MRINTNMAALNAWRSMTVNSGNMTKSLEKLSSGYRVNRAADDAAGLAVSEKMRAQIRGLNMAVRNAQDGVSMLQTAEGGAQKVQDLLQRMRELAVQASSGTLESADRAKLDAEFSELKSEIDRTAKSTTFNKLELISDAADGSESGTDRTVKIQIGANNTTNVDDFELTLTNLSTTALLNGITWDDDGDGGTSEVQLLLADLKLADEANATGAALGANAKMAIDVLDTALETVNTARATFGAYQNRLESTIQTLQIQSENLTAAESRIRDVDMAQEMASFTKYQILQQASTAMLAQANQSTQSILSLLQ